MILYSIRFSFCLAIFFFAYKIFLEKEKSHKFKRFFLLIGIFISLTIPFVSIHSATQIKQIVGETEMLIQNETFHWKPAITNLLVGIYLVVLSLLLCRFLVDVYRFIIKLKKCEQKNYHGVKVILCPKTTSPYTFLTYIFVNKNTFESLANELMNHELTHVKQRHSYDILLIEFLKIIFWFNPIMGSYKRAIQLNHEFLADSTVINQHKNTFQYQHLLLNKAAWKNEYYLASNLNYSLTKKRLLMMTTQSSKTKIYLKKLAVIPLLIGSIFLFAERVEAQSNLIDKSVTKTASENLIDKQNKDLVTSSTNILTDKKDESFKNVITEINIKYNIDSYKKLHYNYETKRNENPHFIKSSENRQKELTNLYSKLSSMYFKLSVTDKKKVKRPINPHNPYLRLMKDNVVFYKLNSELTKEDKLLIPPPPPAPNASKKEIAKAKKAYKNWKKRAGNNGIIPPPPPRKQKSKIKITPNKKVKNKATEQQVKRELISLKDLDVIAPKDIATMNVIKGSKGTDSIKIDLKKKHKKLNTKYIYTTKASKESTNLEKSNKVKYYLDHKLITKKEMKLLNTDKIESVNVKKNKDGSGAIYITSKKEK